MTVQHAISDLSQCTTIDQLQVVLENLHPVRRHPSGVFFSYDGSHKYAIPLKKVVFKFQELSKKEMSPAKLFYSYVSLTFLKMRGEEEVSGPAFWRAVCRICRFVRSFFPDVEIKLDNVLRQKNIVVGADKIQSVYIYAMMKEVFLPKTDASRNLEKELLHAFGFKNLEPVKRLARGFVFHQKKGQRERAVMLVKVAQNFLEESYRNSDEFLRRLSVRLVAMSASHFSETLEVITIRKKWEEVRVSLRALPDEVQECFDESCVDEKKVARVLTCYLTEQGAEPDRQFPYLPYRGESLLHLAVKLIEYGNHGFSFYQTMAIQIVRVVNRYRSLDWIRDRINQQLWDAYMRSECAYRRPYISTHSRAI